MIHISKKFVLIGLNENMWALVLNHYLSWLRRTSWVHIYVVSSDCAVRYRRTHDPIHVVLLYMMISQRIRNSS